MSASCHTALLEEGTPQMATITTATYKPRIKRGSRQHIYHVESATRPGTFYTTDAYNMTCPCPAGRKGKRCWHLATAISYDAWRKAQQARAAAPARPAGMAALTEAISA